MLVHIGYYSPAWPPEGAANGIATYVKMMQQALHSQGHAVSIVSPGMIHCPDGTSIPVPWTRSLSDSIASRLRRMAGLPDFGLEAVGGMIARTFASAHQRLHLDIVEMEESFGWAATVQKALPVPVVVRLHGPHFLGQCDIETGEAAVRSGLRATAEGRAIRSARFLSAPSATLLATTLKHYGSTALDAQFIPNPIASAPNLPLWSLKHCDRDLVLCVGRFDRRKGADIAMQGFLRVLQQRPQARLIMAGPQPGLQIDGEVLDFEQFCARYVPPEIRGNIEHVGLLNPEEVSALRLRAFITIVCSRFENFPYAIAEAMSLGCPVIATRSFGNAEMITDGVTGKLIDVEAPDQLADALCWAFANPSTMADFGAAGREECARRYAPDVIAAESLALYRGALS